MDREPLLQNICSMKTKNSSSYSTTNKGQYPFKRSLSEYLKYGVILLDKPQKPSSHEVVTWIKTILNCEKTGHAGTLDPMVSGCLNVFLNRSTRLVKSQQESGKTYVAVLKADKKIDRGKLEEAVRFFVGPLLQRPPLMCAVKRNLRLRTIYELDLLEVDGDRALIKVRCESGTYIRTLCTHLGLYMNNISVMDELRRIQSGISSEEQCVTLHDILDSYNIYKEEGVETYLRRVVQPLETLLVNYKRIIVKDSCVEAICSGAALMVKGILKYDTGIMKGDTVVVITTKGEAICLLDLLMGESDLAIFEEGIVGKSKRVIMEKGIYGKAWGFCKEFDIYSDH